jgi:2-polyprenyl-3-methyl-5-hydroxy-6-metoxy-1,4-benzoquinol methylase
VHEKVIELLDNEPTQNVLDVGCGEGDLLYSAIANKKVDYEHANGCDLIDQLSRHSKLKFTKADLNMGLPFKDKSFDVITCIEVIEHLENPSLLVRELYRTLKPNGTLIISTPNLQNIFGRILFFFTGRFIHFFSDEDLSLEKHNHIHPMFDWLLGNLLLDKFIVEKETFSCGIMPLLGLKLPANWLFGNVRILKLRRIN